MSISFSRIIENAEGRDFYYTTLQSIREVLEIPSSVLSDNNATRLIRRYSKYLNKITGQWFEPVKLVRHFNGLGQRILDLEDGAPILFLRSSEIVRERTQGLREIIDFVSPLSSLLDGAIEERFLSISPSGRGLQSAYAFPRGTSNILLDAWWGRLEQPKYLETYVSSGIVSSGTNSLQLQDTKNINQVLTFGTEAYNTKNPKFGFDNNIRKRDVLIFVDSDERELGRRIVNSIDYSTNMVVFDSFLEDPINTISSGIKVLTFGATPEDVQDIVNQFILDNYQSADTGENSAAFARGIKQEKTDLYQYTRFTPLEGGTAINEELTSSPIINNLISEYCVDGHVSI